MRLGGLDISSGGGKVTFAGKDPVRKTVMKVGAATASILAANSVASAAIWKERTGEGQDIHADMRKTWVEQSPWQLDALEYTKINGVHKMFNLNLFGTGATTLIPTRDNKWMALCPMYPSEEHKILTLLNCGPAKEQLYQASLKRDSEELEAAAMVAQVPLHKVRTVEEFKASEQWTDHNNTPLIDIIKIGESEPIPLPKGKRPLSGLRVLSFVKAVAGPSCPRQLAAQGADCLNLNMPDWVELGNFFFQSEAGLRQAYLDARKPANREKVYDLIKEADVFVDNLRPGLVDEEGYSPQELAERKPGIITVSIKMNTHNGPWSHWPGFDVNAAAIFGLYTAEGTPDQPYMPAQVNVICDILTGYLGAIGVQAALLRRAKEGGSYAIHISLTKCVNFIMSLGLVDKEVFANLENMGPDHQIMTPNLVTGMTGFGEYTRCGSQVDMSKTPEYWEDPMLYVPGSCKPEWISK